MTLEGTWDLIVARVSVQKGQLIFPCSGIYYLINSRKGECIFWVGVIEVGVVHAHMPLSIFLGDNHNVGYPFGVLVFSDEPCHEEPIDLFFDYFSALG